MRNLKLYAAMAITTLAVAGTSVPSQAASLQKKVVQINGRDCIVYVMTNCAQKPGNGQPDTEKPEIPDMPEIPEEPDTPEIPEEPDMPDSPVIPDTPDVPDTPAAPEAPEEVSYAEQVVRLVNEERAKAGLSALTVDAGLEAAGLVRAKEIVTSFSHTRPDGSSFATAIKEQGVSYRGAGENIAWGQKSPEAVVSAWMNSEGHRANILNEKFTRIGVGHYQNNGGTNYWVQLFAY